MLYTKKGDLHPDFSLFWIKQRDPEAWQALQTLLHEADGREILLIILGKPSAWDNTPGKIPKNGQSTQAQRDQEIFLRIQDAALY